MPTMSEFVAQLYQNTSPQSAPEGTQKLANAEVFAKLAADNNIDLSNFSPEDVNSMYTKLFNKEASVATPAPDTEKLATAHFLEKRAFADKVAEADVIGRVMARSMVDELGVIQQEKIAGGMPPQFMKKDEGDKGAPPAKKDDKEEEKDEKKEAAAAFELLAMQHAVKLASEVGHDPAGISKQVEAVHTLGLLGNESEKVASLCRRPNATAAEAVAVRGLEYLEKIGMQVDWEKVFGTPQA